MILRSTDRVLNVNGSRNLETLGIVTKMDVIRVGVCSLFPAARRFADEHGDGAIRISIVTDRLSDAGKALYAEMAEKHALSVEFVDSRSDGNGPSFQTQVDVASRDRDDAVALFLEDDYLLSPDALTVPYAVLSECSNVGGLNPHFHTDRIRRQGVSRFCAIDGRVFGRVDNSCCTFFVPVADLKKICGISVAMTAGRTAQSTRSGSAACFSRRSDGLWRSICTSLTSRLSSALTRYASLARNDSIDFLKFASEKWSATKRRPRSPSSFAKARSS